MNRTKQVFPGQPVKHNIKHKRNDDFTLPIRGFNKDGTPYDFSGHTFLLQIKKRATDDTSVVEIPNASFTISQDSLGVTASVQNIVTIEHAGSNFDINPREYQYDLQMTDGVGKVITFVEGIFEVTQDVSRPTP